MQSSGRKLRHLLIHLCGRWLHWLFSCESSLAEEPVVVDVLKNPKVMGRTSLFSVPGSIIIKTTLVKSVTEALWCTQTMFLSKQVWTVWQMDRCSDAQISWRLYTSGKAYSNLVLQATGLWVLKTCFHYKNGSNLEEEIQFLEFLVNLIKRKPDLNFFQ